MKDAPSEYRHPAESPRSSSQKVMAYPTLQWRSVCEQQDLQLLRLTPWHAPEPGGEAGHKANVVHDDVSTTLSRRSHFAVMLNVSKRGLSIISAA
jgi:hypothetical protein